MRATCSALPPYPFAQGYPAKEAGQSLKGGLSQAAQHILEQVQIFKNRERLLSGLGGVGV